MWVHLLRNPGYIFISIYCSQCGIFVPLACFLPTRFLWSGSGVLWDGEKPLVSVLHDIIFSFSMYRIFVSCSIKFTTFYESSLIRRQDLLFLQQQSPLPNEVTGKKMLMQLSLRARSSSVLKSSVLVNIINDQHIVIYLDFKALMQNKIGFSKLSSVYRNSQYIYSPKGCYHQFFRRVIKYQYFP